MNDENNQNETPQPDAALGATDADIQAGTEATPGSEMAPVEAEPLEAEAPATGNSDTGSNESGASSEQPTPVEQPADTAVEAAGSTEAGTDTAPVSSDQSIPVAETENSEQSLPVEAATAPVETTPEMVAFTITGSMSGKGSVPVGTTYADAFKAAGVDIKGQTVRADGHAVTHEAKITAPSDGPLAITTSKRASGG